MRIVVLDGYTANPGDLSWEPLRQLGDVTIYDRTPPELAVERARGAEILFTNKTMVTADLLAQLPGLRYVGLFSTGTNAVDLQAARQHGVTVTNVPAYSTPSVTQMVFAHLLNFSMHVQEHSQGVREGRWAASVDFCYWEHPLTELSGLTLGIIGFGQIGKAVARVAHAFGMRVLVHTRRPPTDVEALRRQDARETHGRDAHATAEHATIAFVDLDTLLRQSDAVTLHTPLTDATAGIINRQNLAKMKPTAYLINTGRGGLIVEQDLADALNAGQLAGAGVDVLSTEPPKPDNPLLKARNITITPHIAWATAAARQRLLKVVVENVRAFLQGKPVNVVNG